MGNAQTNCSCRSVVDEVSMQRQGPAVVDDGEIQYVLRKRPYQEVSLLPVDQVSSRSGQVSARCNEASFSRALNNGLSVVVSDVGGVNKSLVFLDQQMTTLSFRDVETGCVKTLPLVEIFEVVVDPATLTRQYCLDNCSVTVLFSTERENVAMQLGSQQERDAFTACVNAASRKMKRTAQLQEEQAAWDLKQQNGMAMLQQLRAEGSLDSWGEDPEQNRTWSRQSYF